MNCLRTIEFGPNGWAHRVEPSECPCLVVAWPPPGAEDEDHGEDAA